MSRPTLRSLAREANVSAATVSMALRGSRQISVETTKVIRLLAEKRGYRPDPQVTKLMRQLRGSSAGGARSNLAAVVEHWNPAALHRAGYYHELISGIRTAVEGFGHAFDIVSMKELAGLRQLDRVLAGRGVEGIFLLPMPKPADLRQRLDWSKYSVVSVTSSVIAPRFHQIIPNHFDNMVHACQELSARGYDRVGLAMSKEWDLRVNHRWAGGSAWYNAHCAPSSIAPLIQDDPGPDLDVDLFVAWLNREQPDAVIFESLDPRILEAALRRIRGKRRPVFATMNWPSTWADCGMDQRPHRIGIAAGEALAAMVARGERGVPESALTTMVDGNWCWKRPPAG